MNGRARSRLRVASATSVDGPALLDGVLAQSRQAMPGPTNWRHVAQYPSHVDALPLQLQDRDSPVSFRNIWVRPLTEAAIARDLGRDGK